ncbi:MAG TPA: tRNA preQ1(34) S-adenosylmethionine ribosyltransferase-isomerase QueA [Terriglobales bacterium]|nr:tRNA preQ1(34) S-adenosylmethionine ribosyltransferase-isomerase QueA [Terriglobales bacterium]
MRLSEFDYELPPERIAQRPLPERDTSRMLWLDRSGGRLEDRMFREFPDLLAPGDLLVANDSRVFPARLAGRLGGGAKVEVLLLGALGDGVWEALVRPGRKLGDGARIAFDDGVTAEVMRRGERGERRLRFAWPSEIEFDAWLAQHGHVPLPPYIRRREGDAPEDRERYQTVYAAGDGKSAAAPTAGLHFSPGLLKRLGERGIEWTTVSLHVGLGTFQPVECEEIENHPIHSERFEVTAPAAAAIARAQGEHRRIIAVGTTAARVLETMAGYGPEFHAGNGETSIFLYPGRRFQLVDGLLTNFHAPRTTLLMMISALAGIENVRRAYQHALANEYRFLSYGDCMLIT